MLTFSIGFPSSFNTVPRNIAESSGAPAVSANTNSSGRMSPDSGDA